MKFQNFLRFRALGEQPTNLYTSKVDSFIKTVQGERYCALVPRSDLYGREIEDVAVVLCEQSNGNGYSPIVPNELEPTASQIAGEIKPQRSEAYTLLRFLVGEIPNGEMRYFAVSRKNGQKVFGTFESNATSKTELLGQIKSHFESLSSAPVRVELKGSVLEVRIYHTNFFYLADEELQIELGKSFYNKNNPTLGYSLIESNVSIPEMIEYEIVVSQSISEGNIFYLGSKLYTAKLGDNSEDILLNLTGGEITITRPSSETIICAAQKGSRSIQNSETANAYSVYQATEGGWDFYRINVTSFVEGNYIEISGAGATTIRYTVATGDTRSIIEAVLNPADYSGRFRVTSGASVSIIVLSGKRTIGNTNAPSITLKKKAIYPAKNVDKYQVIVGGDIQANNIFTLGDNVYVATEEDTDASVANGLGYPAPVFVVSVDTGTHLIAYAKPGLEPGLEKVLDISIIEGPIVRKSSQIVLNFYIEGSQKDYVLGLLDKTNNEIFAISNTLRHYSVVPNNTILLEVSDYGQVYCYDYAEDSLYQSIRIPAALSMPINSIEEQSVTMLDGSVQKGNTRLFQKQSLVTRQISSEHALALAYWLQHRYVVIDRIAYLASGGYRDMPVSLIMQSKQVKCDLLVQGHATNYENFFEFSNQQLYGKIVVNRPSYGAKLFLTNGFEISTLIDGEQSFKVGEYNLEIYTESSMVEVLIFSDGLFLTKCLIPAYSRGFLRDELIRVNSNMMIVFDIIKITNNIVVETVDTTTYLLPEEIQYMNEYRQNTDEISFNSDFSEDFAN
ncbi:hypothetical protein [Runella zeae]|uniref:hypothetical protein n=1 Tax=Runella zeae TaxID=94255 RepID=UPI0004004A14|nr:hypothetical protein [Runella zeae]